MDDKTQLLRHTVATLAYRGGKTLRGAPAEFAEFRAIAAKHFVREEALMRASGYPRHAEHRREHEDALIQLDRFVEMLANAHYGVMNADSLRGKMHSFLSRWLLSHIMYNDLKMRPYVQNMREAAKNLAPLRAA